MCTNFFKKPTNAHERMNVILLLSNHRHVSVAGVADHFPGGNNKHAIKLMCQNQSTVKSHIIPIKFAVKGLSYSTDWYKILEDNKLLCT